MAFLWQMAAGALPRSQSVPQQMWRLKSEPEEGQIQPQIWRSGCGSLQVPAYSREEFVPTAVISHRRLQPGYLADEAAALQLPYVAAQQPAVAQLGRGEAAPSLSQHPGFGHTVRIANSSFKLAQTMFHL
ncbi:hypothetical protein K470DRAFT_255545 [Piedraia hortae CBS 480.64]|uniref:Uncharacterized protein n=1 Tax=Piedraia hortae CBS 480.64 TaxID=1314780 RepID=A0A6A7C6C2_9PEZI|nr:hypothetical protein K470DRAFT_255545 [Piedraia hortae CBS 480.64]